MMVPRPPDDRYQGSVGILLPPVWTHVFLPQARLVLHALDALGYPVEIVEYDRRIRHDWHVVFGWSLFHEPFPAGMKYVLYQMEPLALPLWQEKMAARGALFEQAAAIWDYSETNLPYLQGLPAVWAPLGFHERLREPASPVDFPEHDVLFTGFLSPRRRSLLERLSERCLISALPRWGADLRAGLANTKLVLNIHQFDALTPLEQPRINYALHQGCFVLSEGSGDAPYPWLPTAPYDELVELVLYYLYHPAERRQRQAEMQEPFRQMRMEEILRGVVEPPAQVDTVEMAEAPSMERPPRPGQLTA